MTQPCEQRARTAHDGLLKASHRELDDRTSEGNPYHPHTRATHKVYRDAAHRSRLVLPCTTRTSEDTPGTRSGPA